MTLNLYDLLTLSFPEREADPCFLLEDGKAISFRELSTATHRVAALLRHENIRPGDRIVVCAPKSPEIVMLYLATLQIGAIFVPLNTAYTANEIDYFFKDAEPSKFVLDAVAVVAAAETFDPDGNVTPRDADDIAAMIYTSGTTGRPKGAMLSHRNLIDGTTSLARLWEFTSRDVLLHALPIFHGHGLLIALHCALVSGAQMVWLTKFDTAAAIASLPRATVMMGVPTFYVRMLADPSFDREACANLRLFISGSAPLLDSVFSAFEERTGHKILERYGLSEALIVASNPIHGPRIAGSVGYALPGLELRIDGEGVGNIQIKGSTVFKGYWRKPAATQSEFTADGYFITGDVGHLDPDGRLWISGRAKDLIISGGYNVYPKEIELVLDEVPGVEESAVVGIPHPDFGEAVVAVMTGTASEAALVAHARAHLAAFKVPKKVISVPELPRNALGKVQKNVLRETYATVFALGGDGR